MISMEFKEFLQEFLDFLYYFISFQVFRSILRFPLKTCFSKKQKHKKHEKNTSRESGDVAVPEPLTLTTRLFWNPVLGPWAPWPLAYKQNWFDVCIGSRIGAETGPSLSYEAEILHARSYIQKTRIPSLWGPRELKYIKICIYLVCLNFFPFLFIFHGILANFRLPSLLQV